MRLIDRYIGREILISSVLAVFVLNIVLVLVEIFRKLLPFILDHNVPLFYLVTILMSLLPTALVYSIPWGFLTAVLLVFGRLSAGNELTAMRTAGLSIWRIARPVLVLAVAASGLCLWIDLYVAPKYLQSLQTAFVQMAKSDPSSVFTGDQVISEFPGRKIFVGKKMGNQLENIRVFELDEDNKPVRVVYARAGTLETDTENRQIIMNLEGSRYEQRDYAQPDDLTKIHDGITIDNFPLAISLDELYTRKQGRRKPEAFLYAELRDELERKREKLGADRAALKETHEDQYRAAIHNDAAQITATATELNKRFSFSLACVTFALIGIPLGITAQRQETTVGFALSLLVALTYFLIIIVVNAFHEKPRVHPEVLIWLPNVIFLLLGGVLFYRLSRR